MFLSTVIPTIGRSTLGRTVQSVLDQAFETSEFEVIVVNDSGQPLPGADWQRSHRVRIVDTIRRERCVARNTGSAIARGQYLHFIDDDDILLPGALQRFWEAAQRLPDASWLFGGWQTVANTGALVNEFRPPLQGNIFALLVAGEGLPLQASIVKASEFFAAGAFDSGPSLTGVEDRDLGRRLALHGTIHFVDGVVAQIRIGEESSTTDWSRTAQRDRLGREKALSADGAFSRLWDSARTGHWRGRVSRAYFASAVWNIERRDVLTCVSRAVHGVNRCVVPCAA
jgi:glycosyltransferase involved in cell wall biosynthesis